MNWFGIEKFVYSIYGSGKVSFISNIMSASIRWIVLWRPPVATDPPISRRNETLVAGGNHFGPDFFFFEISLSI